MTAKKNQPAESNPAVARCLKAWNAAYRATERNGEDEEECAYVAAMAYCEALPPLFGVRNIRNYIACVAHGVAIGAIDRSEGSGLIYAAQVAFSTRRIRPSSRQNAPSQPKKHPSRAISGPVSAIQEPFRPALPAAEPVLPK